MPNKIIAVSRLYSFLCSPTMSLKTRPNECLKVTSIPMRVVSRGKYSAIFCESIEYCFSSINPLQKNELEIKKLLSNSFPLNSTSTFLNCFNCSSSLTPPAVSLDRKSSKKAFTASDVFAYQLEITCIYLSMGLAPCRGYHPIYTLRNSLHSSTIEPSSTN